MKETLQRRQAIRNGEPITVCGLKLYPIRMPFYEDFLACRDAICLRLSSLPAKYAVQDYLSAIFAMEIDAQRQKDSIGHGLFGRVMRFFVLSLQLNEETADLSQIVRYSIDNGTIKIQSLSILQEGSAKEITPLQFSSQIRKALAEINGLELPDEAENAELIADNEMRKELLNRGKKSLNQNIDDQIASVAYLSGAREADILTWTVREFELRRRAIDRDKNYTMYGQAELSGMVSFKHGNPAPSWCFDAVDNDLGSVSMEDMQKTLSGASPGNGQPAV